jgi:hypothetical protein
MVRGLLVSGSPASKTTVSIIIRQVMRDSIIVNPDFARQNQSGNEGMIESVKMRGRMTREDEGAR